MVEEKLANCRRYYFNPLSHNSSTSACEVRKPWSDMNLTMEQGTKMIIKKIVWWIKMNWMIIIALAIILYLLTWIKPVK
mgnify:CR=1 FL=1